MPAARKLKCPSCGRIVYADDATLTVSHEVPECARFAALNANAASTSIGVLNERGELVPITSKPR